jgi:hypothetical protein
MVRCWLDAQVDLNLSRLQKGGGAISLDRRSNEDQMSESLSGGSEHISLPQMGPGSWPYQILDQQPRDMASLLQKLHSRCNTSHSCTIVVSTSHCWFFLGPNLLWYKSSHCFSIVIVLEVKFRHPR